MTQQCAVLINLIYNAHNLFKAAIFIIIQDVELLPVRLYQRRSKYFTLCSSHLYRFWTQNLCTSTAEHQGHWAVQNTKEGSGNSFLSTLYWQANRMCFVKCEQLHLFQHNMRHVMPDFTACKIALWYQNLKQKKKLKLEIR